LSPAENKPASVPLGADLYLCSFTAIIALALYIGASLLPPPFFDPLGSAAVPKAVAVILAVLASLVLWPAWKNHTVANTGRGSGLIKGALIVLLAFVYTWLLDQRLTPFWIATLIFVPLAGATISSSRSVLVVNLLIGAVLGIGGQLVFTRFFYIDLPV